jgi:hypothetical protein
MTIKHSSCLILSSLLVLTTAQWLHAQCASGDSNCVGSDCDGANNTVEVAYGDSTDNIYFGSFRRDLSNNARILTYTDPTRVRRGTASIRHEVWTSTTDPTMRAELNDVGMGVHPLKNSSGQPYYYWYGWSFYIPDNAQWQKSGLRQYLAQWRYQNTSGCVDSKSCAGVTIGGSGHHMLYDNGRLTFDLFPQDSACSYIPRRVKKVALDLGTCPRGVWVDVMIRALWTNNSNGNVAIWVQRNNGGYALAANYTGANWVDQYGPGCGYGLASKPVSAPNWQMGLYWGSDYGLSTGPTASSPRILYTDSIVMNRTLCSTGQGSDAWNRTNPAP